MLSSVSSTTVRTGSVISGKSLSQTLPTSESKTPEQETVDQPEEAALGKSKASSKASLTPPKSKSRSTSPKSSKSPLSSRAQRIKNSLKKTNVVSAVLLKADGTCEEIKYNTSSKQANTLVNGRPTIIGELEDIQVIIVRSLSSCGPLNKHILPVPFCNKKYNGDYLLYRVNVEGNPINLSLKDYKNYELTNKKLTEQAMKNYNPVDNQEIRRKPSSRNDHK